MQRINVILTCHEATEGVMVWWRCRGRGGADRESKGGTSAHASGGNRREHMTKRESNQVLGSQDLILVFKVNQSLSTRTRHHTSVHYLGHMALLYGLGFWH